jgi:hypothetical protein
MRASAILKVHKSLKESILVQFYGSTAVAVIVLSRVAHWNQSIGADADARYLFVRL